MATDYLAVTEENKRLYGESDWYAELLSDMYVDRTHFLLELLQNADDAGATRLRFRLTEDYLDLLHDGRPFDGRDVRGVCGLREGTKANDEAQIGRFGIGFKSVYVYTRTPEIHSGVEHFRIRSYVRPEAADAIATDRDWTTLIRLPFDREDVSSEQAITQISSGLQRLKPRLLLFLRHVDQVEWVTPDTTDLLLREATTWRGLRRRELDGSKDETHAEHWIVFEQPLTQHEAPSTARAELAFLIEEVDENEWRVRPASDTELVVFFPTARATDLGHLLQGPFTPTATRDNVRWPHDYNRLVVESAAAILPDALTSLSDASLIDAEALEALLLLSERDEPDELIRPIVLASRLAVFERPLVEAQCGELVPAAQVRSPRVAWLRDVLDSPALTALLGEDRELHWAAREVSSSRTPRLFRALGGRWGHRSWAPLVPGFEFDVDDLLDLVNATFMESQRNRLGDRWLLDLFEELGTQRFLKNAIQRAEILPLSGGGWSRAVDRDGNPTAWLPTGAETGFPVLERGIADDERAESLLRLLELSKPDLADVAVRSVLPKYASGPPPAWDSDEHLEDIKLIAAGLKQSSDASSDRLLDALDDLPLVRGANAATGNEAWCVLGDLYLRTSVLSAFLSGNPTATFLHDQYLEFATGLLLAGVDDEFNIKLRERGRGGYVVTLDKHGQHERGLDGFDPGFSVHGLDHALEHPTLERSKLVWELLNDHVEQLEGTVESSSNQSFSNAKRTRQRSPAGHLAIESAWLPDREGNFKRPEELTLDDLPEDFPHYAGLGSVLGMSAEATSAAEALGISTAELSLLRANPEHVEKLVAQLRRQADSRSADEPLDLGQASEEIEDTLTRPATAPAEPEVFLSGEARNPSLRRERAEDQVREEAALKQLSTRSWRLAAGGPRRENSADVRQYLFERYGGNCQICGSTFTQANGLPYFEAVRLISRLRADWVDRPGLALCLCATCSAKLRYGPVEAPAFLDEVRRFRAKAEGGTAPPELMLQLGGTDYAVSYDERHLIDLQAVIMASARGTEGED